MPFACDRCDYFLRWPRLAKRCVRLAVLLCVALAVGACSRRGGCSQGPQPVATTAPAARGGEAAAVPAATTGPSSALTPEEFAYKLGHKRPLPSVEELAVEAAVVDHYIVWAQAQGWDRPVVLDVSKEEEAALLAMLPQHVPPLRERDSVRVDEVSWTASDPQTGRVVTLLGVKVESIRPPRIPGDGQEAMVIKWESTSGGEIRYEVKKLSGRWVVIRRYVAIAG